VVEVTMGSAKRSCRFWRTKLAYSGSVDSRDTVLTLRVHLEQRRLARSVASNDASLSWMTAVMTGCTRSIFKVDVVIVPTVEADEYCQG